MTRDAILSEMYFSEELKRGAKYLLRNHRDGAELSKDLLSDCIIKVFKKPDNEINDLYSRKKLTAFIYFSMLNAIRMEIRSGKFGDYGINKDEYNLYWHDEKEETKSIAIEITHDELEYSEKIFGCASELNVKFMREIEKADSCKITNPEMWEAAQLTKLYFEFKSHRKISQVTGISRSIVTDTIKRFTNSIERKRMNVMVVTAGNREPRTGMELYRLHYPYFDGLHQSHSDELTIKRATYNYITTAPVEALEDDVYVFSRLADVSMAGKIIESGKKLVIDVDDYWNLHPEHPLRNDPKNISNTDSIKQTLKMAHLVTTTTSNLWERLYDELGVTATIVKNTIPDQSQFHQSTFSHTKVRIGWMGGAHHIQDVELMREGIAKIYADKTLQGKFQFCLGGFNPNEHFLKYESVMAGDYKAFKNADTDYYQYLQQHTPALSHIAYNKVYRRIWARPVNGYGEGYGELDIVLIPLQGKQANGNQNHFNACKSELKLIEAAHCCKAIICSDVMPYAPYLEHEKNCLVVNPNRQDWATQIRRLILDKDLRDEIATNLQKKMKKEFSHANETNKLLSALKKLMK